MIRINNLTLELNGKKIIDNMSFSIKKGEKVCIWGPSGSGKTSLLRILMGQLEIKSGEILIDNSPLTASTLQAIRGKIAWVPQNINLPVNTGNELADLLGSSGDFRNKVKEFVEQLGMSEDLLSKNFNEISGGQKQRIILANCLALERPLLLMDEPTSALDNHAIDLLISTIFSNKKQTLISATHNEKWKQQCDRLINL